MDAISDLWKRLTHNRLAAIAGSLAVIVLGVALIAVGEVNNWGWTRLVGAGIISAASVLGGALIGWSDPIRPRIAAILSSWSVAIVILLTLVMVVPLLAGLVMLLGRAIVGGIPGEWYLVFAGVLIALLLLAVTIGSGATAVTLALRGLWRSQDIRGAGVGEKDQV